ncbi:hypothetical protein D3C86_2123730 [compost metagenome]
MNIIRSNQADANVFCKLYEQRINLLLFRQSVILELQIEVFPEGRFITKCRSLGLFVSSMQQMLGHFSAKTSA